MEKTIAFIAEEYGEKNFTSGGIRLNFEIIKYFLTQGYTVDIYAKKFYVISDFCRKYYSFSELKNVDLEKKYLFVLSEKGIYASDVTYIHDHSYNFRNKRILSPFLNLLYKIFCRKQHNKRVQKDNIIRKNLKNINTIIVSSNVLKNDYIENFDVSEKNITILPPPVIDIVTKHIQNKDDDMFVFGLCAIGFERKGGYIALKAIKQLKKNYKNFKVKIIYPKMQKNFYLKLLLNLYGIKDYVEFLPSQEDMNLFYQSINCLIMPSIIEPFGMVATEALTSKIPVIVPSHSGAADVVINGKNGYVFDFAQNPAKELSKVMTIMLNLPKDTYNQMTENAYLSTQNFQAQEFTQKYFDIVQKTKNKQLDF